MSVLTRRLWKIRWFLSFDPIGIEKFPRNGSTPNSTKLRSVLHTARSLPSLDTGNRRLCSLVHERFRVQTKPLVLKGKIRNSLLDEGALFSLWSSNERAFLCGCGLFRYFVCLFLLSRLRLICVVCVWFILYDSLRKAVKTHLAFLFSFSFRLKRNLRVRHCDKIYVFFLSKHLNIS